MWPQTLEMSRDECRGMLRRLELESYSHIVSVFRAQGSLSEPKAKLLEELRQLFHITQERHCAEVRRAANDEQLCTIAENVCGPNTWQEWSREGRRPYSMLPRISPQTALTIVANDLAAKAYAENAKLAAPAETGANLTDALREQANYLILKHGISKVQEPHVVMDEPFKVPDLPTEIKKAALKRKEADIGETKPNKKNKNISHEKYLVQAQHLASTMGAGKDEDGQAAPLEQRPNARTLQQRYFYQQQQKHKQRMAGKKGAGNAAANHSGNAGGGANTKPAKSGRRRAQKQLQQQLQQQKQQHQEQQQQKQQQQQQQQQPQQQQKVLLPIPLPTPDTAQPLQPVLQAPLPNSNHLVQPHVEYILDEALKTVAATKLKTTPATRAAFSSPDMQTPTATPRSIVNSPIILKEKLSPGGQQVLQQQPQLSTPVKKYIVEDRQPSTPSINIATSSLPLSPQIISVQQIAGPPKVRAAGGTAILPPGTKLTPKKINLIDKQQLPSVPGTAVRLLPYDQQSSLTGAPVISNLSSSKSPATAAVQKYIVEERVPSQSPAMATPLSSASAVNIIKNIPASSLNNTLITPLAAGSGTPVTPLFRKATTATATTASGISGSTAPPQILGNIKLTSGGAIKNAVHCSALRNIKICSPNGKVFLQPAKLPAGSIIHKLNTASVAGGAVGSASMTVTAANTALSPTGSGTPTSPQPTQQRITIQKMQLLTPTQVISSGAGSSGATSGVSVVSSLTASGSKVKPTTLTLSPAGVGKNNLVFLPTSGMRAVTLASSKPKGGAGELLAAKPNVLVIGAAPSPAANAASNTQTVVATSTSNVTKAKSSQLITEDTPIDIINMPIIVADNNATESKAATKAAPMMVLNATDWEMELDQASKATTVAPSSSSAASPSTATTTTNASPNANTTNSQTLEDVIVEEAVSEEIVESTHDRQLNNRLIEVQGDDGGAIEYVDMELEQPIEIESSSSSNISKETLAATGSANSTSKAAITTLRDQSKMELASKVEIATPTTPTTTPATTPTAVAVKITATTSTLP